MTRLLRTMSAFAAVALGFGLLGVPASAAALSAPAAPSAGAASFGPTGAVVTWVDNSSDETGFSVERCLGVTCSAFGQIATVGASVTSFTDLFYTSGTILYRVRAFNSAGYSTYSNSAELIVISTGDVVPRMSATPVSGSAPLRVTFEEVTSTALNGTVTSWAWSFRDNQTASSPTVEHDYAAPGVYAASLKVTTSGAFRRVFCQHRDDHHRHATAPGGAERPRCHVAHTGTDPPHLGQPRQFSNQAHAPALRGASSTSFSQISVLATSATSYLDSKASPGATYSYRLVASNATASTYSNTAVATARR